MERPAAASDLTEVVCPSEQEAAVVDAVALTSAVEYCSALVLVASAVPVVLSQRSR